VTIVLTSERRLITVVMMALAPAVAVTIALPPVSSADCAAGQWWDPGANVCRPPLLPPAG
jgi:hypothetical protein